MDSTQVCAIWGTSASIEPVTGDGKILLSARAGGKYYISRTAITMIKNISETERVLLTDSLMEQRRLGNSTPKITSGILDTNKSRRSLSVHERAENLLRFLSQETHQIGHFVKYLPDDIIHGYLAWTSSINANEVQFLSEFCDQKGWTEYKNKTAGTRVGAFHQGIRLLPQGYAEVANFDNFGSGSSKAFVAMWFDPSMQNVYSEGIAPAIRSCGFDPVRIDELEHIDKIDDKIIAEIRRSKFIVADFTSKPNEPRGGVYYEAGFAQGLGLPVIWTCSEALIGHVHFDTRQFNHITWKTADDLREKLETRILAVIGEYPNGL